MQPHAVKVPVTASVSIKYELWSEAQPQLGLVGPIR